MNERSRIPLFDLIFLLSDVMDMISPAVVNHHYRVAYIASAIASELGLTPDEKANLLLASALHDCGALSLEERINVLQFEAKHPHLHAEQGYLLLSDFRPCQRAATLIRYHHTQWHWGEGSSVGGHPVPVGSHILHLADRIAVLVNSRREVLSQAKGIHRRIEEQSGRMFVPQFVDAFAGLGSREHFWLDLLSPSLGSILSCTTQSHTIELGRSELLGLGDTLRRMIDYRSPYTATHSMGVAVVAEKLARTVHLPEGQCHLMKVAGQIHDLGKLAIPKEILEKPGGLTTKEKQLMHRHPYLTYRTLEAVKGMAELSSWASFHHERLDGNGYPFHLKAEDLSAGSRIMAVADVFTAITEDRPYRKGMQRRETAQTLEKMVKVKALDGDIVSALMFHFDDINAVRMEARKTSTGQYRQLVGTQGRC
ncbi:MAG: HD domain-containing phosphohydrolase [Syntrophorhabdales bacterium]|jgi:HD-GYP domain-containing protein (c-di-GMP phosphodiesterase class II)